MFSASAWKAELRPEITNRRDTLAAMLSVELVVDG